MFENVNIKNHKIACHKLDKIKNKVFLFIKQNLGKVSEYDVKEFILKEFEKENIISDFDAPIVAVNENSGFMHYFPGVFLYCIVWSSTLCKIILH